MKYARSIVIGLLAFACTFVLASAALSILFTPRPTSLALNSANPAQAAPRATPTARPGRNPRTPESTPAPLATAADTATPTEIPPLAPPTTLTSASAPPISSAAFQQGMMLRRDGDYTNAAQAFRAALKEQPAAPFAREAQFRYGESLWLAGDNANAKTALTALLAASDTDNLAARAHYLLADIFTQQHEYGQAVAQLRAYRARTQSLAGEIDAQIGDALLASGDSAGAIAQYNAALGDATLTATQRAQFMVKIADAEVQANAPQAAAARLAEALTVAPDNVTRAEVEYHWGLVLEANQQHADAVSHWRHALAAYPEGAGAYLSLVELLNANEAVDDFQRGLADYNYGSYDAAVQAFNRYAQANPTHSGEALYLAGMASKQNGDYGLAVQSFDALLQNQANDPRAPDALYNKADSQVKNGDLGGGVASYKQFAARYPADSRADDALWNAGKALEAAGDGGGARALYAQLVAQYPASTYAPTAQFNIGFDYFLNQDNANAQAQWKEVVSAYPNTTDADHALFWLGKVANANGDAALAQQFLTAAAQPPRSYYSWRALDLLAPNHAPPAYDVGAYALNAQPGEVAAFEKWLATWTGGAPVTAQLPAAVQNNFFFRRGSELAQLDQAASARLDLAKVLDHFKGDARSLYPLARYFQDNDLFDLSIQAARQIQALSPASSDEQLPRYLRELIYPTYYADLIVPYAQRNGFDPALFFALIRQESLFNPQSKSWVGAAGLTQVMPQTGDGIARDLGVRNFNQSDLYKPTVSVRFGTYFFGQLMKYFDGDVLYSLAGYNAGPGNAKKWQRPDVDVAVEIIHLAQSYLYVRTVYSQYNQYLEIYRGR